MTRRWQSILAPAVSALLVPVALWAQQPTTITGRVTDNAGTPLPAATIYIKDLNLGTLTDNNGHYSLVVPASRVHGQEIQLQATQLGYKPVTATLTLSTGALSHDFSMQVDPLMLQQVVVTGQGTQTTRAKLATALSTVSGQTIVDSHETNVVEALAGKAPGVQVTSSGGDPGAGSYINIRGAASITGGSQPLFIVDGTPIDNSSDNTDPQGNVAGTVVTNGAADINPEDIATVEILKGAAATAIYGSRAANGVVLITTKSGKPGENRATLTTSISHNEVTSTVPLQTAYGQGSGGQASTSSSLSWGPLLGSGTQIFDHATEIYQPANQWNTNLSLSGGSENTTYYLSIAHMDEPGVIRGPQSYRDTDVRLKGSHFFLDNLEVTGDIAYVNTGGSFVQQGSNISGIQLAALRTPPNFDNMPYLDPTNDIQRTYRDPNPQSLTEAHGYDNPFWVAYMEPTTSNVGRAYGNVGVDLTPVPWLKVSYLLGADYSTDDRVALFPKSSDAFLEGAITRSDLIHSLFDSNLTATATGTLLPGLTGTLTLGQNLNQTQFHQNLVNGTTLLNGTSETNFAVTNLGDEFKSTVRTDGYFYTGQATWQNQLTVDLTGRWDGSSTFGGQNRFFYPGAGVAWTFSNTFNKIPLLSYGKLRASWGESGRQPPVFSNVNAYTTGSFVDGWVTNGLFSLYDGHEGVFSQATLANPNIKPELVNEWEAGADLAFLDQRLSVSVTYYNRRTTDAILAVPVPPSTGYTSQFQNAAAWKNHGLEAEVDLQALRSHTLDWSVGAQWSMERSCVTSLAGAENVFLDGFTDPFDAVVGPTSNGACHPFGVLYGTDFVRYGRGSVDQLTGKPIDGTANVPKGTIYVDSTGYPELDPQYRVIGNPNPTWTGSVHTSLRFFDNLTISGLLDIVAGQQRWNGTQGALSYFGTAASTAPYHGAGVTETYAQFSGQKVAGPGAAKAVAFDQSWFTSNIGSGFTGPSSQFIEPAGFVKLRDISISYTLDQPWVRNLGVRSVELQLSGRNLATWTKYTGIDPESNLTGQSIGRGLDYFTNPQTRSFVFQVSINK
jgi:TonB-linked SusC/RagA family outer membrane protein